MANRNSCIAVVILEDRLGRICLQLRDNKTTIPHPNHWALFGGHVEEGEAPLTALIREIAEELTISLSLQKITFINKFQLEAGKEHHLFNYPLNGEWHGASLREGQLYKWFSPAAIQQKELDGRLLIPSHWQMLNWYWALSAST